MWRLSFTEAALADLESILDWTSEEFGPLQTERYQHLLRENFTELESAGHQAPRVKARPLIREGLFSLHVSKRGKHGRHIIFFRTLNNETLEILRILHDAMDVESHLA